MKLHAPFVQLPLQFDAGRLAQEIAVFAEGAWQPQRQQLPGIHVLPLICANGNLDSEGTVGPMRPTVHLARCPYLMEVLASLDAVWGKVRLIKSNDRAGITRHADASYYAVDHMSLHVAIATHAGTRFLASGVEIQMDAGECWVIDTWREHRVVNDQGGERVHLVSDTVGGYTFRGLFDNGRLQKQTIPSWRPQFVAPSGMATRLRFESTNAPLVMTPWELRERVGLLLGDARPHPKLALVRDALVQFVSAWHVLWTRYGLGAHGRKVYREALENIGRFMEGEATDLQLSNHVAFLQALRNIVLEMALSEG